MICIVGFQKVSGRRSPPVDSFGPYCDLWNSSVILTVPGGASEIGFSEYHPQWKEHDERYSTVLQKEQASLQGLVYHAKAEKRWDSWEAKQIKYTLRLSFNRFPFHSPVLSGVNIQYLHQCSSVLRYQPRQKLNNYSTTHTYRHLYTNSHMGCAVGQNCKSPFRCLERQVLDVVLSCVYRWTYNFVASDTVNPEKFSLATFKSVAVTNHISNFTRSSQKGQGRDQRIP